MARLNQLKDAAKEAAAKQAAAQGAAPVVADTASYTDADPSLVGKVVTAMGNADLAWAIIGQGGNLQFAVTLTNGNVVNCYMNVAGTAAAKRNLTHPAQRTPRERAAKPDASQLFKGL